MAQNEQIDAVQDTTLVVDAASGVLANDPGATLVLPQVQLLRTSAGGQIYFKVDGSYTYISAPGFTGEDTVQYTTDNAGTGTLTLHVTAVALLPFVSVGTQLGERLPVIHGFGQVGNGVATSTSTPIPLSGGGYVIEVGYLDQAFGAVREFRTYDADHNLLNVFEPEQPIGGRAIVALPDGGFVLAYTLRTVIPDPSDPSDTILVAKNYVRVFDAAGNSVSGPTLSEVPGDRDAISGLAALPDGGFVLLQFSLDGGNPQLYAQSFSAAGVPESQQYAIGNSDQTRSPTILANGEIVVQQPDFEFHLQRFDVHGNPIGGEIDLAGVGLGIIGVRMVGRPEGGFVAHWMSAISNGHPPEQTAHLQIVDADGNLVGTAASTDLTFSTLFGEPIGTASVTPLTNGGFVVRWRGVIENGETSDRVQAYDAGGNAVGSPIFFEVLTPFGTTRALVFALPEGGFAIGLQAGNPADHDELLIYDNNGSLVGGVRMHDLGDGTDASSFFLANLANGDTLIGGQTFTDNPAENDNWAQTIRFDTPTPVVESSQIGGATPYSAVVLPVRVSIPADADGSEIVESLVISGLPAGWTVSHPSATATLNAGVWTVTGLGLTKIDLHVTAPFGTPGSGTFTVVAHTLDTDNGSRNASFPAPYDFADLPPLNPPAITSNGGGNAAAMQVAENLMAVTTVVATTDLDGPSLSYAIAGGADAARFVIDVLNGTLAFAAAPDFEAPTDADGNNVYEVVVQVSDLAGIDQQALSVTVSNVKGARIEGTDGNDIVKPGKTVAGEPLPTGEEDRIFGFFGNDRLASGDGNDVLIGSRGDDRLAGQDGDDRLAGGFGRNVLKGGDGDDVFLFNERLGVGLSLGFDDPLGHSRIVGFEVGEDRIALEKSVFKSLAKIDYDAATGALTFDPGAPGGERIQFATLAKNLALTDADFDLV